MSKTHIIGILFNYYKHIFHLLSTEIDSPLDIIRILFGNYLHIALKSIINAPKLKTALPLRTSQVKYSSIWAYSVYTPSVLQHTFVHNTVQTAQNRAAL